MGVLDSAIKQLNQLLVEILALIRTIDSHRKPTSSLLPNSHRDQ